MADITYVSTKFPDGYVNVTYEAAIGITGAVTAVTAGAVQSGALPPGLVVNATDHVRITGKPTTAGTFTFTLSLTDTAGAVTSPSYTINVHSRMSGEHYMSVPTADQMKFEWPTEF